MVCRHPVKEEAISAPRKPYPSDLTDQEWEIIEPLVPKPESRGRPRAHEDRELLNAIFYVLRTGCAWRMLPHDFGMPWQTAYHYFRLWRLEGCWRRMHDELREDARARAGRDPLPSAAIIDSQSVGTAEKGGR